MSKTVIIFIGLQINNDNNSNDVIVISEEAIVLSAIGASFFILSGYLSCGAVLPRLESHLDLCGMRGLQMSGPSLSLFRAEGQVQTQCVGIWCGNETHHLFGAESTL